MVSRAVAAARKDAGRFPSASVGAVRSAGVMAPPSRWLSVRCHPLDDILFVIHSMTCYNFIEAHWQQLPTTNKEVFFQC
ncbi:hypothetical protein Stsp02_44720 [Streptomyces sp. NBRC 14336]|nr:hypothetical protein Stsp02_44720 [Streptomyces sp. NBRC 14336]